MAGLVRVLLSRLEFSVHPLQTDSGPITWWRRTCRFQRARYRALLLEPRPPLRTLASMPICMPPISRRSFLHRSLWAGAGLAFAPALRAAAKDADPHLWALLADTHLPADRTKTQRGISMVGHFQTVTQQLLALPRRPAGILIAGDLALNSGEAADYATLRELLRPLSAARYPVHLALGNHDHRERFLDALTEQPAAQRPVATHLVAIIPGWRANWFLLDSLEQTLSTPGLLGDAQLNWLAEALDRHSDKPALIVLHHNLDAKNGAFSLKDAPGLFEVIRPRKQVKACVFGHTHLWRTWTDESGIHCVNLPPVAYTFQPADPSGWVQAALARNGVKLKLRCVDPKHPSHGQVVDLTWRAG